MSLNSLLTLKNNLNTELNNVSSIESNLNLTKNDILSAMQDKVGVSASESIESINRTYSYSFNNGYKVLKEGSSCLEDLYNTFDCSIKKANDIIKIATDITKELKNL